MTLCSRRTEYLKRIRRTQAAMAEKSIELLVVCDPANMNYLTGYDGWSFYVPQAVLVINDQEEPVWIGRNMDRNRGHAHRVHQTGQHDRVPGRLRPVRCKASHETLWGM